MDLHVLGPVEASVGDEPIAIGAGKPRALLAMLALSEGTPVSSEALIDGLWGEAPPATATKMVQIYVSQLRKAFRGSGNGAEIVTRGHAYELRLGEGEVDARRFEQLLAAGDPRRALALWRGPPLDDVATEPFASLEIRRLEELRLDAIELALQQDLAAGRHAQVVRELQTLVAQEPLRERLHGLLMLALYRCGRQAQALGAYRRARDILIREIGVEPGPELRRLHEAVLRQDPALDLPVPAELPPELETTGLLAGREDALEALREHWERATHGDGAELLVAGEPGSGKTRLAAALAADVHADGGIVLYVSGAGPAEAAERAIERARAARRPTLLVLDDADHAHGDLASGRPLLVLRTATSGPKPTLTLGPLDEAAVAEIAGAYPDAPPLDELVAESGGVPARVHRTIRAHLRRAAASRLGASADRTASERARLQAAEDDLTASVVELQAAGEPASAPASVGCPFKGLASFEFDDAGVFFGRERLVAETVARLAGAPLLGIVGPSGSGKSSAMKAGLLPALADGVLPGSEDWAIALLRPGAQPVAALERALAGAPPDRRVVLAVDQFEELFTACPDEGERAAFATALVAAVRDPRRRACVLIALRADFYGRCASYPELWRMLGAAHVPVGPMRRDELRRAIVQPAQRAGLRVDDALVDTLVADVAGEPGALPLLSTALLELWQQRDGSRLAFPAYDRAGGVRGAVARLAERVYGELSPDEQPVARSILERLAGVGDEGQAVRRRLPLAELERTPGATAVLSKLADGRLVSVSQDQAEVAHEALLREWPRLREWLDEDAEGRRLHHHLHTAAGEWNGRGRDQGELYRGARLAAALDWSAAHDPELGDVERAFLDESKAASTRSQRRLRAILGGVGVLLVLAVLAGLVALHQRGTAREQATAAEAQRLGSRALAENDLDRSLLLARQGVALDDNPLTRGSLLAALNRSPAAIGVLRGAKEGFTGLALSPNGRTLAAGDAAGNLFLFDSRTRRRVRAPDVQAGEWPIGTLAFSPDGRRLAVAHGSPDGDVVTLVDARTRALGRQLRLYDFDRAVTGLRFEADAFDVASRPDGIQSSLAGSLVERFDLRSGRRILGPVVLGSSQGSALVGTSDGRRVLTASNRRLVVRDARTLKPAQEVATGVKGEVVVALSPNDRVVALGGQDGSVRFVDLGSGTVQRASGRHRGAVTAASFTPDGRSLVTASDDGEAILWNVDAASASETLSGHANGITALQVSRDGGTLYTTGLDGALFVWDLTGTKRLGRPIEAGGPNATLSALSADGARLALGHANGTISAVDLARPDRSRTFTVVPDGKAVTGIQFIPGGRLAVVVGKGDFTGVVDTDTGRTLGGAVTRYNNEDEGPGRFTPSVSADGRLLATVRDIGSNNIIVALWALPSLRPIGEVTVDRTIYDVQLSPDGRRFTVVLANAGLVGGSVETWDVRTHRRVRTMKFSRIQSLARFSPDGKLLAVGNRSGETRVYDAATFKPVTRVLSGEAGGIVGAAITPDNHTLATGSQTGAVQLWDIHSGQALGPPLPGVSSSGAIPAFTPDGSHLVASYATGRAYVWDMRPRSLVEHACKVAGRRLTRAEWEAFLPGRAYAPAC
jgi:WD40 repeat protein/DNA-binding SARP family transcriptional activator